MRLITNVSRHSKVICIMRKWSKDRWVQIPETKALGRSLRAQDSIPGCSLHASVQVLRAENTPQFRYYVAYAFAYENKIIERRGSERNGPVTPLRYNSPFHFTPD